MLSSVEAIPTAIAGWNVAGFDCTPSVCQATWARTPVGTVVGFLQQAEAKGWQVKTATGNIATTLYLVDSQARVAGVDDLAEEAIFRSAFESKLQLLQLAGMQYGFVAAVSVDPVAVALKGAPPIPASSLSVVQALPWKMGSATVRGFNLFALRGTPDYLDHPGVAIKSITADMKSNEWTMELIYATR